MWLNLTLAYKWMLDRNTMLPSLTQEKWLSWVSPGTVTAVHGTEEAAFCPFGSDFEISA
jgi:hypothetical protein